MKVIHTTQPTTGRRYLLEISELELMALGAAARRYLQGAEVEEWAERELLALPEILQAVEGEDPRGRRRLARAISRALVAGRKQPGTR